MKEEEKQSLIWDAMLGKAQAELRKAVADAEAAELTRDYVRKVIANNPALSDVLGKAWRPS